jgi:hypothetical protein
MEGLVVPIAMPFVPEYGAVFRVKALTTVIARNFIESQAVVLGFAKKLH